MTLLYHYQYKRSKIFFIFFIFTFFSYHTWEYHFKSTLVTMFIPCLVLSRYLVVVFTGRDMLHNENITPADFLPNEGKQLFQEGSPIYNQRCVAFNNKADRDENAAQVNSLLNVIDCMVVQNGDSSFYSMKKFMSTRETLYQKITSSAVQRSLTVNTNNLILLFLVLNCVLTYFNTDQKNAVSSELTYPMSMLTAGLGQYMEEKQTVQLGCDEPPPSTEMDLTNSIYPRIMLHAVGSGWCLEMEEKWIVKGYYDPPTLDVHHEPLMGLFGYIFFCFIFFTALSFWLLLIIQGLCLLARQEFLILIVTIICFLVMSSVISIAIEIALKNAMLVIDTPRQTVVGFVYALPYSPSYKLLIYLIELSFWLLPFSSCFILFQVLQSLARKEFLSLITTIVCFLIISLVISLAFNNILLKTHMGAPMVVSFLYTFTYVQLFTSWTEFSFWLILFSSWLVLFIKVLCLLSKQEFLSLIKTTICFLVISSILLCAFPIDQTDQHVDNPTNGQTTMDFLQNQCLLFSKFVFDFTTISTCLIFLSSSLILVIKVFYLLTKQEFLSLIKTTVCFLVTSLFTSVAIYYIHQKTGWYVDTTINGQTMMGLTNLFNVFNTLQTLLLGLFFSSSLILFSSCLILFIKSFAYLIQAGIF